VTDFDTFYAAYPRRVGKLDAIRAYAKARTVATADEILAGVALYKANKPEYADWCHPATWLNKGRWMDEYDAPAPVPVEADWFAECQQLHDGSCGGKLRHHNRIGMDAYMAKHRRNEAAS